MCNLGEAIEARGEARGKKLGEARGKKLGEARGKKLGEARMRTLCIKMQEDNRLAEYLKAVEDEAHLQVLYAEYDL